MSLQTKEEIIDALDEELAWRQMELSFVYLNVKEASNTKLKTQLRIGVAMLYAHWEGFIKKSSNIYLDYLSNQNLLYKDINDNYIALTLKGDFKSCVNSYKTSMHTEIVKKKFLERTIVKFNNKKTIDTNDNLNWETFDEILKTLGFDNTSYIVNSALISDTLVYTRNHVAHGEYIDIDKDTFIDLYNRVRGMMISYKEQIIDYVNYEYYLK